MMDYLPTVDLPNSAVIENQDHGALWYTEPGAEFDALPRDHPRTDLQSIKILADQCLSANALF